jgi:hypothetical protein
LKKGIVSTYSGAFLKRQKGYEMDVFYTAYRKENELNIEAFSNKNELNSFVKELKAEKTNYKVVKLQNNASLKSFIDLVSDNKLNNAYHKMMQRNR